MFVIVVFLFFIVLVALVVLLEFKGARQIFQIAHGKVRKQGRLLAKGESLVGRASLRLKMLGGVLFEPVKLAVDHPILTLLAGLALGVPAVLAVLMSSKVAIFEFSDIDPAVDQQIAILMEGERLVPPVELPPAVFKTKEVEQVRPNVVFASRNWQLLDAVFTQRLLMVFKLMKERHGYSLTLLEGYRSPERQAQLFSKGKSVTKAKANMSYHQYGLAGDVAFLRDGKVVISEKDAWAMRGYELYGQLAEELGLTWGGRWTFKDFGHVELRRKGVLGRAVADENSSE